MKTDSQYLVGKLRTKDAGFYMCSLKCRAAGEYATSDDSEPFPVTVDKVTGG